MGFEVGPTEPGLIRELLDEAPGFSFFQLVQLLERSRAGAARVGRDGPVSREAIRFRPAASFAFPTSDVAAVELEEGADGIPRYRVEVSFLGLYGSVSPLPNYFTEEILQESGDDSLVREFMDLFHHRLISLFYRCWEKYRYHVLFRGEGEDEFSRRVLCLMGVGLVRPGRGDALAGARLLRYCGLLARQPCSALALERTIADWHDGLPSRVVPFAGRWVRIPADQRSRLGSANAVLGETAQAGEEVLDRAGRFRIVIGPVGLEQFVRFLPGEEGFRTLQEMASLFLRDRLEFETEAIVHRDEIPELRLSEDSVAARLGRTSWLGHPTEDGRVVFEEPRRTDRAAAA